MILVGTPQEIKLFEDKCDDSICEHCVLRFFCTGRSFYLKESSTSKMEAIIRNDGIDKFKPILITNKKE